MSSGNSSSRSSSHAPDSRASWLENEHYTLVMNVLRYISREYGQDAGSASRHTAAYIFNTFIAPAIHSDKRYPLNAEQQQSIQFGAQGLKYFFSQHDIRVAMQCQSNNSKFKSFSLLPLATADEAAHAETAAMTPRSFHTASTVTMRSVSDSNTSVMSHSLPSSPASSTASSDSTITLSKAQLADMIQNAANTAVLTALHPPTHEHRYTKRASPTDSDAHTAPLNKKQKVHNSSSSTMSLLPAKAPDNSRKRTTRTRQLYSPSSHESPSRKKTTLAPATLSTAASAPTAPTTLDNDNKFDSAVIPTSDNTIAAVLESDAPTISDPASDFLCSASDILHAGDVMFPIPEDSLQVLQSLLESQSADNVENIFTQVLKNETVSSYKTKKERINKMLAIARQSPLEYQAIADQLNPYRTRSL